MQSKLHPSQKTVLFSLVCICCIGVGVFIFMWSDIKSTGGSICKTSQYSQVEVGMTKQQLMQLWGEPSTKRAKDTTDQNLFYQGANEAKIKEGWIYRNDYPDRAEIYFDSSGLVNGKNCGQG